MNGLGCGCGGGCNHGQSGMGQFDPISAIASAVSNVFGGVMGYETAKRNAATVNNTNKANLQIAKINASNAFNQQQYQAAVQAQQDAVAVSQSQRNAEIIALVAIGGAAVVIAGIFLYGATKK